MYTGIPTYGEICSHRSGAFLSYGFYLSDLVILWIEFDDLYKRTEIFLVGFLITKLLLI